MFWRLHQINRGSPGSAQTRQMEAGHAEALAALREAHKMEIRRALRTQAQGLNKQYAGELSVARTAALEELRFSEQSFAQLKEQCSALSIEVWALPHFD